MLKSTRGGSARHSARGGWRGGRIAIALIALTDAGLAVTNAVVGYNVFACGLLAFALVLIWILPAKGTPSGERETIYAEDFYE